MTESFDPTGGRPGQVRFFLPGPVWVRDAVRQAMSPRGDRPPRQGLRRPLRADSAAPAEGVPHRRLRLHGDRGGHRALGGGPASTSCPSGSWRSSRAPSRNAGRLRARPRLCDRPRRGAVGEAGGPRRRRTRARERPLRGRDRRALGDLHRHAQRSGRDRARRAGEIRRLRARGRRDLAGGIARRVGRVEPGLRPLGLAEGAGPSAGTRRGLRLEAIPGAGARALAGALPAPFGGRGLRREAPDALHALDTAPLRARPPARPHPDGDAGGPVGAPRGPAPPRRDVGRRSGATPARRPRGRARGPCPA